MPTKDPLEHRFLEALLGGIVDGAPEEAPRALQNEPFDGNFPAYAARLATLAERFCEKHEFKVGDMVVVKEGLSISKFPAVGEPGVVVEVREEPLVSKTKKFTSPLFNVPLDVAVGVICPHGHFEVFWFDSRRLRPVTEADYVAVV